MKKEHRFYIDGEWVNSTSSEVIEVENPSTEEIIGTISAGTKEDIDMAVKSAKNAFQSFAFSSKEERIALLEEITKGCFVRIDMARSLCETSCSVLYLSSHS